MILSEKKISTSNKSLIFIICLGLFTGLFLKLFVVDILYVSGTSMEPTIKNNSTIIANKLQYGISLPYTEKLFVQWANPKKNDIVIYLYNDKIVVKRCVAVSGELLEYSSNPLYTLRVGEKEIPLTENQYKKISSFSSVPKGYILAIGDNYQDSVDSRTYGFVSVKNILGKVICK